MEIKHLEYFIEVARYKSFSKAAEKIHASQPNISKAIKDLEQELGKTLFYRSNKQVQLTDAGELILHEADRIVASFRNIHTMLDGLEHLQTGEIYIGLPPITAVTSFSSVLGLFKSKYPKIKIQLSEYGPKHIESVLQDGLLDFGIFTPENTDLFEWIWFDKDPHWLIMNAHHPLADKVTIAYRDLDKQHLILYTKEYKLHDYLLNRCFQSNAYPEIVLETAQLEMITSMVQIGLGLAFLPSKICKRLIGNPGLKCIPMSEQMIPLELALTWRRGRYLSHAAMCFLEVFKASGLTE